MHYIYQHKVSQLRRNTPNYSNYLELTSGVGELYRWCMSGGLDFWNGSKAVLPEHLVNFVQTYVALSSVARSMNTRSSDLRERLSGIEQDGGQPMPNSTQRGKLIRFSDLAAAGMRAEVCSQQLTRSFGPEIGIEATGGFAVLRLRPQHDGKRSKHVLSRFVIGNEDYRNRWKNLMELTAPARA